MTTQLAPTPVFKAFDNNGLPLANGMLYSYIAGTTIPQATYTDSTGSTPNTNPVVLNARGEANVWLNPTQGYKLVLTDSLGNQIWSVDGIIGPVNVNQSLIPAADNTYSLGSPSAAWSQLYLGANHAPALNGGIVGYWPQTAAEFAAGVTPTNLQYQSGNVLRYGLVGDGVTDNSAALVNANKVGISLTFPSGVYAIAADITLTSALIFDSGAMLKPAAAITVTINAPVQAGPWQIFNISNSGVLITGTVQPVNNYNRLLTEWFGALGNGTTDDTIAIQATAALAAASGYIGIQLLAKTYLITTTIYAGGANSQVFYAPSWFGVEKRKTTISYAGIAAGTGAFFFRGGSGQLCGAVVQDIGFIGNSTSYGIVFSGQCGMRVIRCLLNTNAEGIRFWNNDAGSFTEYCVADNCEFTTTCTTAAHYVVGSGNDSFHGSGLANRCLLNQNGGSAVLVDTGAHPYNAPLDLQVWANAPNTTIVTNNSTIAVSFSGRITLEPSSTNNVILGGGSGTLIPFAGEILGNGQWVVAGTLLQCRAIILNSDGSITPLGVRKAYQQAMASGANTIVSSVFSQHRIVYIKFIAANYDYRYFLDIDADGGGSAGYVTTLASIKSFNSAGYGAPTFTVSTSGELIATNASWPATGVTAYYSEETVSPGVAGSFQQQI